MSIQFYANADANGNIIAYYNDDIWDVTKIPTTAIKITQAQWQDAVANQGKYIVQAGALALAPPPTAAQQLASAQNTQIASINAACQQALQNFTSTALGSMHTYLSRSDSINNDWSLFNGEFSFVTGAYYDNNPILWYTVETGNVNHTKNQFIQAFLNGRSAVALRKQQAATLEAQIKAVTTNPTDVYAIAWSDPWAAAPATPTGLAGTAGAAGSGQATLNWTANTDAVMANGGGYNIYVDGATIPKNAALVTGTTFTVTGLTVGAHTFQITAVGANGKESAKCSAVSVTVS